MAEPAWGSLAFREQIEFFLQKLSLPTATWRDIWQAAHDRAFVVAGAMQADLLDDLRMAVQKGIDQGATLAEFRRDFEAIVKHHGWTGWTGEGTKAGRAWRTRVIYETNLRTSYAAGRWAQLKAAGFPYLRYRHNDNVMVPRPHHLAWDGLILAADDPWWATHATPNGWGCQCWIEGVSAREMRRLGKTRPDPAPTAPDDLTGIDEGWAYAPGASVAQDLGRLLRQKLAKLPQQIGADLAKAVTERLRKQLAGESDRATQAIHAWLAGGRVGPRPEGVTDRQRAAARQYIVERETRTPFEAIGHGMTAPEQHVRFEWEGLTFTYDPANREAVVKTVVDLANASVLPRRLAKYAREIIFTTQANKHDAYWAATYNRPGFVSYATGGDGRTVVYNGRGINVASLAHEMGHSMATSKYGSPDPRPWSDFGAAVASGESPPTDYAKAAIAEDFAESVKLYVTDKPKLRTTAPKRYRVIDRLMKEDGYGG